MNRRIRKKKDKKITEAINGLIFIAERQEQQRQAAIRRFVKRCEALFAPNEKRESFFKDANRMSGEELFNKYFPETFKVKAEHSIRLACYKLGIYSVAKKLYVRLTHKY